MARVYERDSDRHHYGADNPNPDLDERCTALVERGMEAIINAEKEKRDPAQKVEMSMCRKGRVIG